MHALRERFHRGRLPMNTRYLLAGVFAVAGLLTLVCALQTLPTIPPDPASVHRAVAAAPSTAAEPPPSDSAAEPATPAPAPTREEISRDLLRRLRMEIARGGDPDGNEVFMQLLAELVENDPEAAARFACSFLPGPLRNTTMHAVAQAWAGQEPREAADWASQLPDPGERTLMLSVICYQIAEADPALAIESAARLDLREQGYGTVANLTQQWAARDFAAASAWALRQPDGTQKDQLLQWIILVRAQTDPFSAGALAAEQIPPGTVQDEAVLTVVNQWARSDVAGAAAWVAGFPPGPLQQRAETQLAVLAGDQKP